MTPELGLAAAFAGGVLTSASPCVLAAIPVAVGFVGGQAQQPARAWSMSVSFVLGMNVSLVLMGIAAARLGVLMGALPGPWHLAVGAVLLALAAWWWLTPSSACSVSLPQPLQRKLFRTGHLGAFLLGGVIGAVMSPCATPALALALTLAGSDALVSGSTLTAIGLLVAYGIGHSILILIVGALPVSASQLASRFTRWNTWLPGRRAFAALLALAGGYWLTIGAGLSY